MFGATAANPGAVPQMGVCNLTSAMSRIGVDDAETSVEASRSDQLLHLIRRLSAAAVGLCCYVTVLRRIYHSSMALSGRTASQRRRPHTHTQLVISDESAWCPVLRETVQGAAGHPGRGDTWACHQSDWTVVVTIPLWTDSCWRFVVEFVL